MRIRLVGLGFSFFFFWIWRLFRDWMERNNLGLALVMTSWNDLDYDLCIEYIGRPRFSFAMN